MKKFLIFTLLFIEAKATDLTHIGLSLDKKKKEASTTQILEKDKSLILKPLKKSKELPEEKNKLRVNVESNCDENYGESRYSAQAGIRYAVNDDFGIETGYELSDLKIESINDLKIDKDHLSFYSRLFLKF